LVNLPLMMNAGDLTPAESSDLEACEASIQAGLDTFVEVGTALLKIRENRLYRLRHGTFEDYCRERWGMSRVHAHRMIEASQVVSNLLPIGNTAPFNEAQARPLARLTPEEQREAWSAAMKKAENGLVRAKQVAEVVDRMFPRDCTVQEGLNRAKQVVAAVDQMFPRNCEENGEAQCQPLIDVTPWTDSESERKAEVEAGRSVLASKRCDGRLIAWAEERGLLVEIDRGHYPLGNPMKIDAHHDRDAVIAWYRDHWLGFHVDAIDWQSIWDGCVLACWCHPEPCHGEAILALARTLQAEADTP
jgi:hypothetical protein